MYSEEQKTEIVNNICKRIVEGESMRNILLDKDLPHLSTFLEWVSKDSEKSEQYARAMEIRAEILFEETLEIADDSSGDEIIDEITGRSKMNSEFVQRSRLRVDTRKWFLSKLNPKKFGEKVFTDITTDGEKINHIKIFELPNNGRTGDN